VASADASWPFERAAGRRERMSRAVWCMWLRDVLMSDGMGDEII
jgi:hypothetical protein